MQRYSNPEVFLCPLYNAPGISNPKMHISEEGRKTLRSSPGSGSTQGLTTQTPVWPSVRPHFSVRHGPELSLTKFLQASTQSSSPQNNSPSSEPSSSDSDSDRKVDDYDRIFEELINAE